MRGPTLEQGTQAELLENISWDSDLVKEARKEYFSKHSYNFTKEGTHNLLEIFRQMAESAKLLGTSTYNIQVLWTGPDDLRQANYALRSLPKGLKFLHMVPPSESPKVMGLMGIHDPDALCHFNGMTHCPWCGKEGQNEGTVVNHLWTVHYRLGLVCNKCNDCPSTSLDTLHHHSWQDCQQSGEKVLDELDVIRVVTSRRQAKSIHLSWESKQRSPGGMVFPWVALMRTPLPIGIAPEEDQWRRHHPPTHTSHHLFSHTT